jgi:GT2 family glycosyltransferase
MDNRKPIFDVVVNTAGRFDMLQVCINAIYKNATLPMTITVVDDASKKDEKQFYWKLFEHDAEKDVHRNILSHTSKRNETQQGYPRSANLGAKKSKGRFIVFISDDVEIHDGYFDQIYEVFQNPNIGVVGSRLLFPPTSTHKGRPAGKIQHVGVALDVRGNSVHPMVGWSPENPKTQHSREVLAVTGALFAIRSDLFHSLGGFDTIYGLGYWEDIDLCLKVRQKGGKIWLDTKASAYHYVAASSEKGVVHNTDFQRNSETFKNRWRTSGLLIPDDWTYG